MFDDITTRSAVTAWIAALWSGEYDKADGYLKEELEGGGVGFCVQGVIADQMVKAGAGEWNGMKYVFPRPSKWKKSSTAYLEGDTAKILQFYERVTYKEMQSIIDSALGEGAYSFDNFSLDGGSESELGMAIRDMLPLINDETEMTFEEFGHVIYELYERKGVELPPKEAIMDLAEEGPCEVKADSMGTVEHEGVPVQ